MPRSRARNLIREMISEAFDTPFPEIAPGESYPPSPPRNWSGGWPEEGAAPSQPVRAVQFDLDIKREEWKKGWLVKMSARYSENAAPIRITKVPTKKQRWYEGIDTEGNIGCTISMYEQYMYEVIGKPIKRDLPPWF